MRGRQHQTMRAVAHRARYPRMFPPKPSGIPKIEMYSRHILTFRHLFTRPVSMRECMHTVAEVSFLSGRGRHQGRLGARNRGRQHWRHDLRGRWFRRQLDPRRRRRRSRSRPARGSCRPCSTARAGRRSRRPRRPGYNNGLWLFRNIYWDGVEPCQRPRSFSPEYEKKSEGRAKAKGQVRRFQRLTTGFAGTEAGGDPSGTELTGPASPTTAKTPEGERTDESTTGEGSGAGRTICGPKRWKPPKSASVKGAYGNASRCSPMASPPADVRRRAK